jgi:hypothetical protein
MEIAATQQSHQRVIADPRVTGSVGMAVRYARQYCAPQDRQIDRHAENLAAALRLLPADHPNGTEAAVTLVGRQACTSPRSRHSLPTILPAQRRSTTAHRRPAMCWVYVSSHAIRAFACDAGVGTYRRRDLGHDDLAAFHPCPIFGAVSTIRVRSRSESRCVKLSLRPCGDCVVSPGAP